MFWFIVIVLIVGFILSVTEEPIPKKKLKDFKAIFAPLGKKHIRCPNCNSVMLIDTYGLAGPEQKTWHCQNEQCNLSIKYNENKSKK